MAYPQKKGRHYYVYVKTPDASKPEGFRYQCFTKHPDSGERWTTKTAARDWGRERERVVNHPKWIDPQLGAMTWDQLWAKWFAAITVEPASEKWYTDTYECHIGPRYGHKPIEETEPNEVDDWLAALRAGTVVTGRPGRRRMYPYKKRSTDGIRMQMSLMLDDAIAKWKLLDANPLKVKRSPMRGKRVDRVRAESRPKPVATPAQVLAAAVNMHELVGAGTLAGMAAFMRVLTAAWTGIRPGEQSALTVADCHPTRKIPMLLVDPDAGSYEELPHAEPRLKAPKGGDGREVLLNVGHAALLAAWLRYIDGPAVFPVDSGERWRHTTWGYWWYKARDGGRVQLRAYTEDGRYTLERHDLLPGVPGVEYKGLRRIQNVWLTEAGVPDVARSHRLGHGMSDPLQAAYSQVSDLLETQLLAALQEMWVEAFAGYAGPAALDVIRQFAPRFGMGAAGRQAIAP
jgi:hypothetical protein